MQDRWKSYEALQRVADRATFYDFVQALADDRRDSAEQEEAKPSSPYGPQANGWENIYIDTFLESALRCAQDSEDADDTPSWRVFAEFLYGGKIYE